MYYEEYSHNILKKKKRKLPAKYIIFFVTAQFLTGLDFGFSEAFIKPFNHICKILTLIVSLYTGCLFMLVVSSLTFNLDFVVDVLSAAQYILYLFFLLNCEYTLYEFLTDILSLTKTMGVKSLTILSINLAITLTLRLYFCIQDQFKSRYKFSDYESDEIHMYLFLMCAMPFYTLDFIPVVQIIVMYDGLRSMKLIRKMLLTNKLSIKGIQRMYLDLAHYYFRIRPIYEKFVLIRLVGDALRLLFGLWNMLHFIQMETDWYMYVSEWVMAAILLYQLSLPAILAEMTTFVSDDIVGNLHNQLVEEEDKERIEELTSLIRYMEARSLRKDIWHIIPIDLRLPLSLLNVCTTYLIVIIQFTHLYD